MFGGTVLKGVTVSPKPAFILTLLLASLCLLPPLALAAGTVRIGVIYPLSGEHAPIGKRLVAGARLAAEIINKIEPKLDLPMAKTLGVPSLKGARLELVVADSGDNGFLASREAVRLIDHEGVVGILGCYYSEQTMAVADICQRRGVPMITSCATLPELTQEDRGWLWRITPHDGMFIEEMYDFLNGIVEGKAPGVPAQNRIDLQMLASACRDDAWGDSNSRVIRLLASRRGFSLGASLIYTPDMPDQLTVARRMKPSKPDGVLIAAHEADALNILKAMEMVHLHPKIIWGQNAGFLSEGMRALGPKAVGICTRMVFSVELAKRSELPQLVNEMFKKRNGTDLNACSARAFTGVQTWWSVLQKAGSTRSTDVRKALSELRVPAKELIVPWLGIQFGELVGEPGQNSLGRGLIGQYQMKDGKLILEVVYPFDLATAKLIYPIPHTGKR